MIEDYAAYHVSVARVKCTEANTLTSLSIQEKEREVT